MSPKSPHAVVEQLREQLDVLVGGPCVIDPDNARELLQIIDDAQAPTPPPAGRRQDFHVEPDDHSFDPRSQHEREELERPLSDKNMRTIFGNLEEPESRLAFDHAAHVRKYLKRISGHFKSRQHPRVLEARKRFTTIQRALDLFFADEAATLEGSIRCVITQEDAAIEIYKSIVDAPKEKKLLGLIAASNYFTHGINGVKRAVSMGLLNVTDRDENRVSMSKGDYGRGVGYFDPVEVVKAAVHLSRLERFTARVAELKLVDHGMCMRLVSVLDEVLQKDEATAYLPQPELKMRSAKDAVGDL